MRAIWSVDDCEAAARRVPANSRLTSSITAAPSGLRRETVDHDDRPAGPAARPAAGRPTGHDRRSGSPSSRSCTGRRARRACRLGAGSRARSSRCRAHRPGLLPGEHLPFAVVSGERQRGERSGGSNGSGVLSSRKQDRVILGSKVWDEASQTRRDVDVTFAPPARSASSGSK